MDKIKLENDIHLVTEAIHNVNIINIGIFVDSGSIYEDDNSRGYSHFVEHLLFRTKNNKEYLIDTLIKKGVKYGAFTTKEYTCYYFRFAPDEKEIIVKTIIDMFKTFRYIEENDFKTERNVILSELNIYLDDPKVENINRLMDISFPNQSISREIIGNKKSIENAKLIDIKKFFNYIYGQSKFVISVTGDIDENFIEFMTNSVKNIEKNKYEKSYPHLKFKSKYNIINKKLQNSIIDISFVHDNCNLKYSDIELYIFNDILGGMGKSSILFNVIRDSLGLAYTIQSYIERFHNLYLINIHSETDQSNIEKFFAELSNIINNVEYYVTDEIIEISYKNYITNLSIGLESPMDRMFFYGNNMISNRDISIDSIYKYKKPSREKMIEIFNDILHSNPSCSIIGDVENINNSFINTFTLRDYNNK